jgi:hypothetical protein
VAFVGFALALTWPFYMGFFPFTVGSAVGLGVLAIAVRAREPTGLTRFTLGFLLLVQAGCHVFTAVLTGLTILVLFVWRAPVGARLREVVKVGLMGLPAAGVLVVSVATGRSLQNIPFAHKVDFAPLSFTLHVLPRIIAPGPWWRVGVIGVLLIVAVVLGGFRALKRGADPTDRSLFVVGILFMVGSALLPMNIPGWQFFSPRFVPLGVVLCLVSLPVERLVRARVRQALATGLFVLSVACVLASNGLHRRLAASVQDALLGLSAPVVRHGLWLPVTLATEGGLPVDVTAREVPFIEPLRHMPMLYALVEGGMTPYTFASTAATYPFVPRTDGPKPLPIPSQEALEPYLQSEAFDKNPAVRRGLENEFATYGMFYEGVLVTGARPEDIAFFRLRGYAEDWSHGSVFVGHFVPCPLDVTIPPSGEPPFIDVGVAAEVLFRDQALTSTDGPDGSRHLTLPAAPCGDVWVRPYWLRKNADGSDGRAYCDNAGNDGEIHAMLTWSSARVECRGAVQGPLSSRTALDSRHGDD